MTNYACSKCRKKLLQKIIFILLDVRPSELAVELNFSRGHLSNLLACKRQSDEFDSWLALRIIEFLKINDEN